MLGNVLNEMYSMMFALPPNHNVRVISIFQINFNDQLKLVSVTSKNNIDMIHFILNKIQTDLDYLRFFAGVLFGVDLVACRLFSGLVCSSALSTDLTSGFTCFGVSLSFFKVSLPISGATRDTVLLLLPLDLS